MPNLAVDQTVRRRREELGLTREQLAAESQTSTSTIARLELQGHMPNARTLARIASVIQLPVDALLSADTAAVAS